MLLEEVNYIILDTETTGFSHEKDKLIEWAFVNCYRNKDKFSTEEYLFNPGVPIPASAMAIHHITNDMVSDKPSLANFKNPIKMSDKGTVFVAHNAAFDSGFLPFLKGPWICTYRLASHLLPDMESYANQFLRYALRLKIPPQYLTTHAHRALYDAIVTKYLFFCLLDLIKSKNITTVDQLIVFQQAPIIQTSIRFGTHKDTRWEDLPKGYVRWILRQDFNSDILFNAQRVL